MICETKSTPFNSEDCAQEKYNKVKAMRQEKYWFYR